MANNRFPFELLPDTLLLEIAKYLSSCDIVNLIMICKATLKKAKQLDQKGLVDKSFLGQNGRYNKTLAHGIDFSGETLASHSFFNSRIYAMQKNLIQAGLHILKANKDVALAMIDNNPGLLLQVIPSITLKKYPSHVGETHVGRKLYQLALGTHDAELYEAIGKRIEDNYGHAVKAQQFNEQFPNGVKSLISYRAIFDALIKTMAADLTIDFVNGQNIMNNTTRAALQALADRLIPKPTDKCTTGVHLDLQIIIDFIEAYEEGLHEFKNEDKRWDQCDLYWRCGFGLIESRVSYFITRALNDGANFFDILEGKKPVTRATGHNDGSDFFDPALGVTHYKLAGAATRAHGTSAAIRCDG